MKSIKKLLIVGLLGTSLFFAEISQAEEKATIGTNGDSSELVDAAGPIKPPGGSPTY
jgi:hypothetical protein